jgi:hypothetical protein
MRSLRFSEGDWGYSTITRRLRRDQHSGSFCCRTTSPCDSVTQGDGCHQIDPRGYEQVGGLGRAGSAELVVSSTMD